LWYGIGILYERYGSLENAEEAFTSVLKKDPKFFFFSFFTKVLKKEMKFISDLELFINNNKNMTKV
jgi:hypothetical protein